MNDEINLRTMRTSLSAAIGKTVTVSDAADLVGVSKRTWQRWEAKNHLPYGALVRFIKKVRAVYAYEFDSDLQSGFWRRASGDEG